MGGNDYFDDGTVWISHVTVTTGITSTGCADAQFYDEGPSDHVIWISVAAVESAPVCLKRPPVLAPVVRRYVRPRPHLVLLNKIIPNPRMTRAPPAMMVA